MAHRRVSLPALKVTQRPTCGEKTVELFLRGVPEPIEQHSQGGPSNDQNLLQSQQAMSTEDIVNHISPFELHTPPGAVNMSSFDIQEPTCFELETKASVAGWERVRQGILVAMTETAAMPLGQICLNCEEEASVRCKQCGPVCFYCVECFQSCHSSVNFFHVAEKWEVARSI